MNWFDAIFTEKKIASVPDIIDPNLGRLEYEDEGWWKGEQLREGKTVSFFIDGTEAGLSPGYNRLCLDALNSFPEYFERSILAVRKTALHYGALEPPTFTDVELCWFWMEAEKSGFSLRLYESGDSGRIWAVKFKDSEITSVGFDD